MVALNRGEAARADDAALIIQVENIAHPLRGEADLDPLLESIGDARFVLLGEASHGTSEFYRWRTAISRRLISEKGFSFVAVEGDWPDCYRINQWIKGRHSSDSTARDVLHAFSRWPTWMWANEEVVELVEWLAGFNRLVSEDRQVGFFGLDVYSLWDSLYQVMGFLRTHDPSAQEAVHRAIQCFQPYGEDVHAYAKASRWVDESCEEQVVRLLSAIRESAAEFAGTDRDVRFNAEQNALIIRNAEEYYRTMIRGGPESWNIRDRHMVQTLERLTVHHGPQSKAIVWEHNTHIGDARYTDMAQAGMVNVGELVRQAHAAEGVMLVGFSSYEGSVIAARAWEAPAERMPVPPGRPGSWEAVLHSIDGDKLLLLGHAPLTPEMFAPRGHRAIGVVYHPEFERGNYVPTILPRRYDALLYIDTTEAVYPLSKMEPIVTGAGDFPETYPTGV